MYLSLSQHYYAILTNDFIPIMNRGNNLDKNCFFFEETAPEIKFEAAK